MTEHELQEHPSSASAEGLEQAEGGEPEEPPQRRGSEEAACLMHHEKRRLLALGLALIALLAGLLLDLLSRNILPLFAVVVLVYLGYTRLDALLAADETNT
jgi:hypothetical protein